MADEQALDRETLKHRLEDVAQDALPHIRMGYHLLSQQSAEQRHAFIEFLLETTETGKRLDREKAIDIIGLNSKVISDVLSAVGLGIGAVLDLNVTQDDFVLAGKGKIFNEEDVLVAQEVVTAVLLRKDALRDGMNSSSLANAVLPSFRSWSGEVDVRLNFDDATGEIASGVPVSVNYLSTDTESNIWFQASVEDLEGIVTTLNRLIDQMKKSQALVRGLRT